MEKTIDAVRLLREEVKDGESSCAIVCAVGKEKNAISVFGDSVDAINALILLGKAIYAMSVKSYGWKAAMSLLELFAKEMMETIEEARKDGE